MICQTVCANPYRSVLGLAAVLLARSVCAQPLPSLAPMIERASPAVVNISVSGHVDVSNPLADDPVFRQFFEDQRDFQSAGSGVIVDAERGLVLTNHHVVANASDITVTLLDSRRASNAEVIGSDPASDLAVLRIPATNLIEMPLGDSDALRVGDYVVAIGNPFGFSHTVTSGIVSGLGRSGINPDPNTYEDFIQTDASINPGNSGGALVDLNGNLVGVNSAILSRGGGNIGIGFAIPVNMVRNVMNQLIEFGEVRRGLLGVTIRSAADLAESYDLTDTSGAIVIEIAPNSAAEAAGIRVDDQIVTIDDKPVRDSSDLRNQIGLLRPGDSIRVGIIRDGRAVTVTAVLGAQAPRSTAAAPVPEQESENEPVLEGVELVSSDENDGLLVRRIDPDSAAAQSGLQEGDLIIRINRQPVSSIAEARALLAGDTAVVLQIRRGNRESLVFIP